MSRYFFELADLEFSPAVLLWTGDQKELHHSLPSVRNTLRVS